MIFRCPCCGAVMSLDVLMAYVEARESLDRLLKQSALGRLLLRYLPMHRPPKRELSMDKAARIINEVLGMVDAGNVTRDGRVYPAPASVWESALAELVKEQDKGKLGLPLSGHGLLLSVIERQVSRGEAVAEQKAIETQRNRQPAPVTVQAGKVTKETGQKHVADMLKNLRGGYGTKESE